MWKVGKLYAEEAVGFLSVTAPCKKATDTSECVGNQNTTREQRNDFIQPCRVFLSEYEIYREETSNTSDKTSDKCHSASQLKAHRWIFYVVIGRLEQRGKAKADNAAATARALFAGGADDENMPRVEVKAEWLTDGAISVVDLMSLTGITASKSEARRLIEGGGVTVDGKKYGGEPIG